jgi:hypothetical protein
MVQKDAKLILQRGDTFADRVKAIETAVSMGVPLSRIEGCLDWTIKPCRMDLQVRPWQHRTTLRRLPRDFTSRDFGRQHEMEGETLRPTDVDVYRT